MVHGVRTPVTVGMAKVIVSVDFIRLLHSLCLGS